MSEDHEEQSRTAEGGTHVPNNSPEYIAELFAKNGLTPGGENVAAAPQPAPPSRPRKTFSAQGRRRLNIAAFGLVGVVVVACIVLAVSGSGGGKSTGTQPVAAAQQATTTAAAANAQTLTVWVTVPGAGKLYDMDASQCLPHEGYTDVEKGTVLDAQGTVIGTLASEPFGHTSTAGKCTVVLTGVDTQPDSPFISLSFGRRPPVTVSLAQLTANNWKEELSITS